MAALAFDEDRELDEIPGGDAATWARLMGWMYRSGIGLSREDGNKRGGVEDHLGRPCSA